jgi:hypothetical protein
MSSAQQVAANQANAQLSTGPRTEAGKKSSSLNALKSGLTGRTVLLPGEDAAAYKAHCEAFMEGFDSVGEEETALVQLLADTRWRLDPLFGARNQPLRSRPGRVPGSLSGRTASGPPSIDSGSHHSAHTNVTSATSRRRKDVCSARSSANSTNCMRFSRSGASSRCKNARSSARQPRLTWLQRKRTSPSTRREMASNFQSKKSKSS